MTTSLKPDGKAITQKTTFSLETAVSITINADPSIIWALLTNASDFTRWNSTVTGLEGEIKLGGKLKLKSYLDDKRIFKIGVKEFQPESRMVWGDGNGTRVFTLEKQEAGVVFSMVEKMGGLTFPLWSRFLPPFEESFERFAADLKKEAEMINNGAN